MTESEIQNKIKNLKSIEPSVDYSASSRSMILMHKANPAFEVPESSAMVAALKALKTIEPDPNYAFQSKLSILETGKLNKNTLRELLRLKNIIYQLTNHGISLGVEAIL